MRNSYLICPYLIYRLISLLYHHRRKSVFNASPTSTAYIPQWNESALVQIMACRLFGAKPLSKPMLGDCQLDTYVQTWMQFYSKYKTFHSPKCIWKYCLRNDGYYVRGRWVKIFFSHWPTIDGCHFNLFTHSDQTAWSPLVQIIAWRLLGTKPLPEPTLTYCLLNSGVHIQIKLYVTFKCFLLRKHFVLCSMRLFLCQWPLSSVVQSSEIVLCCTDIS